MRQKSEIDCALAQVTQGRPMRVVCSVLGASHNNITTLITKKSDWVDRSKAPPKQDDAQLLEDIKNVGRELPSYGYRRNFGVLRHRGFDGGKPTVGYHKRVYHLMQDQILLLYRHGNKSGNTRKHGGTVAFKTSALGGVQMPSS